MPGCPTDLILSITNLRSKEQSWFFDVFSRMIWITMKYTHLWKFIAVLYSSTGTESSLLVFHPEWFTMCTLMSLDGSKLACWLKLDVCFIVGTGSQRPIQLEPNHVSFAQNKLIPIDILCYLARQRNEDQKLKRWNHGWCNRAAFYLF